MSGIKKVSGTPPVEPVVPTQGVDSKRPPTALESILKKGTGGKDKEAAPGVVAEFSNLGYDLSTATPEQAAQLLTTQIMADPKVEALMVLKGALERRASGEPAQEQDADALQNASSTVTSLGSNSEKAMRMASQNAAIKAAGGAPKPIVPQAHAVEFNDMARSFGPQQSQHL